jgi:cell division protein FtsN
MSRDYKSRKTSTTRKSSSSLIAGIFIGYTLGLVSAIGVWMYISQAPSPFLTEEKPTTTQKTTQTETSSEKKIAEVDEKPKFDFYKILPGIEEPVVEQDLEQAIQQQAAPTTENQTSNIPSEQYFLQAGAFRSTDEAENLKARLALLGVVATVQSAHLPEKGLWHRVRIGPFTNMDNVNQVRTSLQQNNIEVSFIKVRENPQ